MNICFLDSKVSKEELSKLYKEDLNIVLIPTSPYLYDAINSHPDIQVNILSGSSFIIAKNSSLDITNEIFNNIDIKFSDKLLKNKYPENIFLNAINLKDYFIHNLKYTDKNLLSAVNNKTLINIKQGYSKCSCAIVSDNALITSDIGIYNTLKPYTDIDVLLIPSGDITLLDLPYGFIGGACGLISKNKIAFFGDLKYHTYGNDILNFLSKYDVEPIYLSDSKLIDKGSILTML
ncbi:DUF6873 family GME fold protein [uncultured Clostridium sp.]|uniref:DUF6873 family GME fold protein n=1 Tax=uncultured Clostridium sp. TaxID=59620 RepID=UPI002624AA5D|nr:hypothetical protein [uncultured Clostridium sp.]